jgi:hypothetical protein
MMQKHDPCPRCGYDPANDLAAAARLAGCRPLAEVLTALRAAARRNGITLVERRPG